MITTKIQEFSGKSLVYITGLFSFGLIAISILLAPPLDRKLTELHYAPPVGTEHFTFGFQENIADSMWLRVIQDFDYCEDTIGRRLCKGSGWVYQILNVISHIAPHFRMPLFAGPLLLTVVVNDVEGASKLFDRAVLLFPHDWGILYAASYQAMVEEKDNVKAADLLVSAAKSGAPPWTYALATKLYEQGGHHDLAVRLAEELKDADITPLIREAIKKRLEEPLSP